MQPEPESKEDSEGVNLSSMQEAITGEVPRLPKVECRVILTEHVGFEMHGNMLMYPS